MVVRGIEFENRVKEQKVETHLVEGGHSLFNFFKAEPFENKSLGNPDVDGLSSI